MHCQGTFRPEKQGHVLNLLLQSEHKNFHADIHGGLPLDASGIKTWTWSATDRRISLASAISC